MYKQGDILLIPLPFSDLSSRKKRPVLVLSNAEYNRLHQDIIVAATNRSERDYLIHIETGDLDEGQLKVESGIRADKIYTFSKQIVVKKFGHVTPEIINKVKEKLNYLFDGSLK